MVLNWLEVQCVYFLGGWLMVVEVSAQSPTSLVNRNVVGLLLSFITLSVQHLILYMSEASTVF